MQTYSRCQWVGHAAVGGVIICAYNTETGDGVRVRVLGVKVALDTEFNFALLFSLFWRI